MASWEMPVGAPAPLAGYVQGAQGFGGSFLGFFSGESAKERREGKSHKCQGKIADGGGVACMGREVKMARRHDGPSPVSQRYRTTWFGICQVGTERKLVRYDRVAGGYVRRGAIFERAFREHAQRRGEFHLQMSVQLRRRAWHPFFCLRSFDKATRPEVPSRLMKVPSRLAELPLRLGKSPLRVAGPPSCVAQSPIRLAELPLRLAEGPIRIMEAKRGVAEREIRHADEAMSLPRAPVHVPRGWLFDTETRGHGDTGGVLEGTRPTSFINADSMAM
jgi:hypothetical protein